MVEVTRKLVLPLVVLGFYPIAKILGEMIGGPDIPLLKNYSTIAECTIWKWEP